MIEPTELPSLPRELHWRCVMVEHDSKLVGWLAGPAFPCVVHYDGAYKPCRFEMTRGKLKCHRCRIARREVWYVPMFTSPGLEQFVTILCKTVGRVLKATPLHTALKITKPKAGTSPAQISRPDPGEVSATAQTRVSLRPSFDVRPYLIHLWQDRELCEWCGLSFIASAATRAGEDAANLTAADTHGEPFSEGAFRLKPA